MQDAYEVKYETNCLHHNEAVRTYYSTIFVGPIGD